MTDVPLRDYIDLRIKSVEDMLDAQSKFNAQHFELNELAIKKAEDTMTLRLDGMNEFREQMKDERLIYATKESTELLLAAYDSRLRKLENTNSFSAGKLWMIMAILAVIPTVLALVALFKG